MKRLLQLFSLSVAAVILIIVLSQVGLADVFFQLRSANLFLIALAVIFFGLAFLVGAFKWYLIIGDLAKKPYMKILPIFLAGSFVDNTTPGARVGGEPLKAYYLARLEKGKLSRYLSTTLVDQAINLIILVMICTFSILCVVLFLDISPVTRIFLEVIIGSILLLIISGIYVNHIVSKKTMEKDIILLLHFVYYFLHFIRKRSLSFQKFEKNILSRIHSFLLGLHKIVKDRKSLNKEMTLGFLAVAAEVLAQFFVFYALGFPINPLLILIVGSLSFLVGAISIVPGGIGIVESVMIALYAGMHIDPTIAAAATLISRTLYYFYSLILGYASLWYLSYRYK